VTHLSILIILLGAIIGVKFGFNASLALPEGETSPVAYKGRERQLPLGFDIRCDNFEVDYYGDSDMPKSYRSWLTVLKDGKEVMKKTISVNDPLSFEGITFYQSSFGTVPNALDRGVVILRAVAKDGRTENINARIGDTFAIPGTDIRGHIVNFSPALSFDQAGRPFTYDQNMENPAVYIDFAGVNGKQYSAWFLKRYPQTWTLPDGNRVEFLDFWGVQYTGLQVRKDPGVLIVYLGCIIMALGLYVTFFMSHRRVWVNISEEKGAARITIGASAHRNRAAFERKIEKLVSILQAGQKGEK
jgi:cytochrome c biogenesis protein